MTSLTLLIGCRLFLVVTSCYHLVAVISAKEYCLDQVFDIKCSPDEVIIVHRASYGRMQLGSCVQRDYGSIGCQAEVTEVLSGSCSGRDSCRVVNMEAYFSRFNKCPLDLKSYLDADVSCIAVHRTPCSNDGLIHLNPHSFDRGNVISGFVSMISQAGMADDAECPYLLDAKPGQRFNITLSDFFELPQNQRHVADSIEAKLGHDPAQAKNFNPEDLEHYQMGQHLLPHPHKDEGSDLCRKYATVWDGSDVKVLTMCRRVAEVFGRLESNYVSLSHRVKVKLEWSPLARYIIKYNVIGCPYPEPPPDAHLVTSPGHDTKWQASPMKITIRCNQTDESLTLNCRNGVYSSEGQATLNCSKKLLQGQSEDWSTTEMKAFFPYGISLLLVAVVATCICLITLAIGLLYVNRKDRRMQNTRKLHALMNGSSIPFDMVSAPGAYDHLATDPSLSKNSTFSKKNSYVDHPHARRPECQYSPVANRNWSAPQGMATPSTPERRLLIPVQSSQDTSRIKLSSPIMSTSNFRGTTTLLPRISALDHPDAIILSDMCPDQLSCFLPPPPPLASPSSVRCSCTLPKQMNKSRIDVLPVKKMNTEKKERKQNQFANNQSKSSSFFATSRATKSNLKSKTSNEKTANPPSTLQQTSNVSLASPPTFSTFKPVDVVESCSQGRTMSHGGADNNEDSFAQQQQHFCPPQQHKCPSDSGIWSGATTPQTLNNNNNNANSFQPPAKNTNFSVTTAQRQQGMTTPKTPKVAGVRFTLTNNDNSADERSLSYMMADHGGALV